MKEIQNCNEGSFIRQQELLRSSTTYEQYKLLCGRGFVMATRNPIAYIALVFLGIMQGLFQASIFKGVGALDFTLDGTHNA